MIQILNSEEIKKWDSLTLIKQNLKEIDLMERACEAFFEEFIKENYNKDLPIYVLCGTGNNGGDGLGIARLLHKKGFRVFVYIVSLSDSRRSSCFQINLERLPYEYQTVNLGECIAFPKQPFILIDAILGSGLSRPVDQELAQLIHQINSTPSYRIAVDIPSGLLSGFENPMHPVAVSCRKTVSFECPKPVFYNPDFSRIVGDWTIVPIGLEASVKNELPTHYFEFTSEDAQTLVPPRNRHSHKGNFGHVLLVAGSQGKIGASILSAKGVMKSGAGKLTCYLPKGSSAVMHTSLPEAMVLQSNSKKEIDGFFPNDWPGVIAIGPGIGNSKNAQKAVISALTNSNNGLVIDADAINVISTLNPDTLRYPKNTVLTPHPNECDRLIGKSDCFADRLNKAIQYCKKYGVIMVLKGGYSAVISQVGEIYFSTSGNPGMATAGSGDVLLGIIAGLLSQGLSALQSAQLGVFLHATSGDIAAEHLGQHSLIAGDLIDYLPKAFLSLSYVSSEKSE